MNSLISSGLHKAWRRDIIKHLEIEEGAKILIFAVERRNARLLWQGKPAPEERCMAWILAKTC